MAGSHGEPERHRTLRRGQIAAAAAVVCAAATPALANPAAVFALATGLHLLVGCAILGLIEGVIIATVLRTRRRRPILLMIAANYFSAWTGFYALVVLRANLVDLFPGPMLLVAPTLLIILVAAAVVLAIVLEYPFALLSQRSPRRRLRALGAVALAHGVSYPLLALWYAPMSGVSLYTGLTHDHTLAFVPPGLDAWVYYIRPEDGSVRRIRINGQENEQVASPGLTAWDERLFVWTTPEARHDLRAGSLTKIATFTLIEGFASSAVVHPNQIGPDDFGGFDKQRGEALDLRPEGERDWLVRVNWYGADGLMCRNERTGEEINFGFDNPLLPARLLASWPTILPGNLIVYQLGDEEFSDDGESCIVVVDLNARTLGLLARGRSPVVGLGAGAARE